MARNKHRVVPFDEATEARVVEAVKNPAQQTLVPPSSGGILPVVDKNGVVLYAVREGGVTKYGKQPHGSFDAVPASPVMPLASFLDDRSLRASQPLEVVDNSGNTFFYEIRGGERGYSLKPGGELDQAPDLPVTTPKPAPAATIPVRVVDGAGDNLWMGLRDRGGVMTPVFSRTIVGDYKAEPQGTVEPYEPVTPVQPIPVRDTEGEVFWFKQHIIDNKLASGYSDRPDGEYNKKPVAPVTPLGSEAKTGDPRPYYDAHGSLFFARIDVGEDGASVSGYSVMPFGDLSFQPEFPISERPSHTVTVTTETHQGRYSVTKGTIAVRFTNKGSTPAMVDGVELAPGKTLNYNPMGTGRYYGVITTVSDSLEVQETREV